MVKRIFWFLLSALLPMLVLCSCTAVKPLCEGDLLFCVSAEGNNITDVTTGVADQKIDHVAIVHFDHGQCYALEATHKGVSLNPIDTFMAQRQNLVMAARLTDTTGVAASVQRALGYLGRPYDFLFMPDDREIYCSELVQLTYRDGKGRLLFNTIPMSFHDSTGKITPFWTDYYERRGLRVPEAMPGSNPGNLSRSSKLRIFKFRWKQRLGNIAQNRRKAE